MGEGVDAAPGSVSTRSFEQCQRKLKSRRHPVRDSAAQEKLHYSRITHDSRQRKCCSQSYGLQPHVAQDKAQDAIDPSLLTLILCNLGTRSLEQMSVLNSRRTCRFTGATTETAIDVGLKRRRIRLQPPFLHRAHQVDATARTVIFIRGRHVGWTRFETQPAVNTGENLFFFVSED